MADKKDTKKKILIVDDDKFLLDMYALKFSECGLSVEASHDAEEALTKLRNGLKTDAILLDIIMPGIDGLELLKTIREEDLGNGTVIIVLSNQGEEADIKKATALGAQGYIIKASTIPSEVLEKVLTIIEKNKK